MHEITILARPGGKEHIWTCSCRSEARSHYGRTSYTAKKARTRAAEHLRRVLKNDRLSEDDKVVSIDIVGSETILVTESGRRLSRPQSPHEMRALNI